MIQTAKQMKDARQLAIDLPMIMHRCHAAGLHATGHAMHEAVRKIGWELAEELSRRRKRAALADEEPKA